MATIIDFDGWLDGIGLDDTVSWHTVDALYYAIKNGGKSGEFEVKENGNQKFVYESGAPDVLRIASPEAEAAFLKVLQHRIGAEDQTIEGWIEFHRGMERE